MNKGIRSLIGIVVVIVLVVALRPFFVLMEGDQAVVTRFGRITNVYTDAGLKAKFPLIDQVTRYSKKILSWDGDPQRLPTSENQFIWVDTTARWRIIDPTVFYQRVNVMTQAYARLDNVIESAVRTVVSKYPLSASVRSTNLLLEIASIPVFEENEEDKEDSVEKIGVSEVVIVEDLLKAAFAPIKNGRKELSEEMLLRAQGSMPEYGIELLDVVIRQIRYSDDLTQSVYDRMISERNKIATGYRSEGKGSKAEWIGRLNRDRDIKLSEADRKAAEIRAEGNAQAARVYANTYNVDPEFYSFWKAMESYKKVLPKQKKILSTDMEFFQYLHKSR